MASNKKAIEARIKEIVEAEKREMFTDSEGRFLTQALFYEIRYDSDAVYSLKDYHFEVDGKIFPSIKLLYMELGDPTEYQFAIKYFASWSHWQRIQSNKIIRGHIESWREELEVKIRSAGVRQTMALAEAGNYQASKFLVDKGWNKRQAGKPSKEEIERNIKIESTIANEYSADVIRLQR